MIRSRLYTGFLAVACAVVAHASTITVTDVTVLHQYQQTTNSPCVFDNSSCNQPAGFPAALLPVASSYNQDSLTYTVGQIGAIVGDSFFVGMDVNQTSTNQTLSLFSMSIGGALTDSTNIAVGGMEVPPTVGGGNGNGYADYILTGFTSLAGLNANTTVTFHVTMPLVNDGREQFFLLSNGGPTSVPEPISVALTGSGLLGLLFLRKRFAKR